MQRIVGMAEIFMFPWELLVRINRNGWKRISVSRWFAIVSHRKQCGGRLFIIKSHSFVRVSCKGEIECWGKLVRHGLYQKHNGELQYCGKIARL